MNVETETLTLSLTKEAANALRREAARTNGNINNIADRVIRAALTPTEGSGS